MFERRNKGILYIEKKGAATQLLKLNFLVERATL